MKIGFVTDIHVLDGKLVEQVEILDAVVDSMSKSEVDLVLVGGDLAGLTVPHRATPRERNALSDFFLALSEFAPVIVVRGNHDFPGDYDFLNTSARITQANRKDEHHITKPIRFVSEPMIKPFEGGEVVVLPWLDRSRFSPGADYRESVLSEYKNVKPSGEGVRLLLAHAAIAGGMIREGQPMVPTEDPTFRVEDLADDSYDAAFFGHYHLPQDLPGPTPAFYGGSLFVSQYGEDFSKGWLLFDTDSKEATRVGVSQPPRLVAEVSFSKGKLSTPKLRPHEGRFSYKSAKGSHIKLVVRTKSEDKTAASVAALDVKKKFEAVARSVKLVFDVEQVSRSREGAVKIAGLPTLKSKVEAYFKQADPKPDAEQTKEALKLLSEFEVEVDRGDE